jgi:hypothetical protein
MTIQLLQLAVLLWIVSIIQSSANAIFYKKKTSFGRGALILALATFVVAVIHAIYF